MTNERLLKGAMQCRWRPVCGSIPLIRFPALALLTPPVPIAEEAAQHNNNPNSSHAVVSAQTLTEASERTPATSLEDLQHYRLLEAGTRPHGNIWKPFFRIKQKRGILSPTNVYKATTAVVLIHNLWEVYVHTRHIMRPRKKIQSDPPYSGKDIPVAYASPETAPAQLWISVVQDTAAGNGRAIGDSSSYSLIGGDGHPLPSGYLDSFEGLAFIRS
ncbi:hypothetical protein EDB86DRAFT_2830194 [Lactarius hatsudake]|nr:hypothetical protein EDB86DRAFT_2830194 [Lactarius hatsudake]